MSSPTSPHHKTDLETAIRNNPWRNAYWFARMLINGDKYGGLGKDSKFMTTLCVAITSILNDMQQPSETKISLCKEVINNLFAQRFSRKTGKSDRIALFLNDLFVKFQSIDDITVFVLTAQSIMVPINIALESIPNDDKIYTESVAKTYLDKLGNQALATVINFWDDAGVAGCLEAERVAVVRGFEHLKYDLNNLPEQDANLVLTAYVQEFERRLGQKRKGRAGGSLEDVTSFLFNYFKIKAEHKPDHFQADIEVDKWIRRKDKWLIGISCKRTLRERWKQVSSASSEVLSKYKIKSIWHVVSYDEDLSDDKLTLLGAQRHVFYLRDDSRRLIHAQKHSGMREYVRPISTFIDDIRREQT